MPEKSSSSPVNLLGTVVGVAGGWTFSHYCGSSAWIPGGTCVLLLLLFAKTSFKPRYFAGAIATTGGHIAWFLIGALILQNWSAVVLDIAMLAIGVIWLWIRPGLGSAVFLGAVQLLSLAWNALSLVSVAFGSPVHRALTAHVVFRILALVCLAVGYWQMKKKQAEQAAAEPPLNPAAPAPAKPDGSAGE